MKRLIGLDVGDKTIGVAVSDGIGLTAQGVTTIIRTNWRKDVGRVLEFAEEYEAGGFVVGLPKKMDGTLGPQSEKVFGFVEKLKGATELPVYMFDERLTTALVQKAMITADVSRSKRKKVVDMLAAQIILQGYMDRTRLKEGDGEEGA
jgi:putative holliday junction resolvase